MAFRKTEREQIRELPEFDPDKKYTPRQLELYATQMLMPETGKNHNYDGGPMWLNDEQFKARYRKEIYTAIGTPDPEIVQGQFFKTHPQGRKTNSDESRKKHGAGFYR